MPLFRRFVALTVAASAAVFALNSTISPAHATAVDPTAEAARSLVGKYKSAAVTLSIVIKMTGFGGDADNSELEVPGVVIDSSGLVVTTNTAIDPAATFASFDAEMASKISARVVSAKILMPDGEDVPVKVVLRDSDRNLAFLRPVSAVKSPMPFVDFKDASKAQIGDPVFLLSHLTSVGNRQAQINQLRIVSVMERPRMMYVLETMGLAALGNVAFDEQGKPLGLVTMRLLPGGRRRTFSANENSLPIIVPAEDVQEEAAQAPAASAVKDTEPPTPMKKPGTAPTPPAKPAPGKKPVK